MKANSVEAREARKLITSSAVAQIDPKKAMEKQLSFFKEMSAKLSRYQLKYANYWVNNNDEPPKAMLTIVITGPTGRGKTHLLNELCRFYLEKFWNRNRNRHKIIGLGQLHEARNLVVGSNMEINPNYIFATERKVCAKISWNDLTDFNMQENILREIERSYVVAIDDIGQGKWENTKTDFHNNLLTQVWEKRKQFFNMTGFCVNIISTNKHPTEWALDSNDKATAFSRWMQREATSEFAFSDADFTLSKIGRAFQDLTAV